MVGYLFGEIGVVYVVGWIGVRDVILIVYYCGMDVNFVCGVGGVKGGMLVVGMLMEEVVDFCFRREYSLGFCIVVSNLFMVVMFLGDFDLIYEVCKYFKGKRLLVWIFNVDMVYYLFYMEVLLIKYLEVIKLCNILLWV